MKNDENRSDRSDNSSSRRKFLRTGAGVLAGAAVVAAASSQIPFAAGIDRSAERASALEQKLTTTVTTLSTTQSQLSSTQSQLTTTQQQTTDLQSELDTVTGFIYLNLNEQSLIEALAEAIIPSDSNGPGAKEAGVIYFIDRQLASDYGSSGTMYMQGPYVLNGTQGPITVDGITYPLGSPNHSLQAGTRLQYSVQMRYFWRWGLDALQSYANSAYGGNFETLSATQQGQILDDLWDNKPTSFNSIVPIDFAYELFFMVWCGFLTDPLNGGNRNMVGWSYTGFNGVNQGNFYGEGHNVKELMLATTPTRLQPASLAQFQKGSP
jgi:gluconate 2-dehydrogenase gamma chain